jgi:hypothetical protein
MERVFLDALREVGTDPQALSRLIGRERAFRDYLVHGLQRFSSHSERYEIVRSMMGDDFISPEEVMLARGMVYTPEQFSMFDNTVPKLEVLRWCRDNDFILMPGPNVPLSLLGIRDREPEYFSRRFFYTRDWSPDVAPFAHDERVGVGWIALRREPIPGSAYSGWDDQLSLLSAGESVPNIAEVAWCMTTHRAVRDTRLFPNVFVRTRSQYADGSRVCLGNDVANGGHLSVYSWSDEHRSEFVLLTTKRNGR